MLPSKLDIGVTCVRVTLLLALGWQAASHPMPQLTGDELTAALIRARTEEEQSTLIARNASLITSELVKAVNAEGHHLWETGDFERAHLVYAAMLKIAEKLGDDRAIAKALNNLGIVYGAQGNYAKALQYLQESYALLEKSNNREGMLDALGNIGNIYRWQLDFDQALAIYHRALALAEVMNDKGRIASPCINIGNLLTEKGDAAAALIYLQRGVALMKQVNDERGVAMGLVTMGNALQSQGRAAEAIASFTDALAIQEKRQDRYGMAYALGSIAFLEVIRGRAEQAIPPATKGLAIAQEGSFRESLWRIATTLGYSYMKLEKYPESRDRFQQAIDTIEEMRQELVGDEREQQRFFTDKLDPYWGMMELAQKQGNVAEALAFAERAKARMLLDVARSGRSRITQTMTSEEQGREQQLVGAIAAATLQLRREMGAPQTQPGRLGELRDRRDRARLEYEKFHTQLYTAHPELKIKRGEVEWTGLDGMVPVLHAGTAIVEFTVTRDEVYGFVITLNPSGGTALRAWIADVSPAELVKQTAEMRRRMQRRDLGFRTYSAKLYDVLLRPAAAELAEKGTVVIIPDRVLWEMPFQALNDHGRYFLEGHVVLYAPSLAVLEATGKAAPAPHAEYSVLAVGDPALGRNDSANRAIQDSQMPLSEAGREVRMIGTLYGPARSTVLTGAYASESRVKSEVGRYDVLHFATHGIRDQKTPMNSHIVLTQPRAGEREDGLLEAWELMKLELQAKLVVLSACETALGAVGDGEGMIGLTWALFIAGTPTVVASQWRVDSRSTTDLMIGMHRELSKTEVPLESSIATARALRDSALRLLRTPAFAHPFYWAGFVTISSRM